MASVFHECCLGTFFLNISVRTVIEIVSGKFHITVEKIECSIETTHPGTGYTVSASESAHSTAHSAATATHSLHHSSCEIIESAVICIVRIQDQTYLAVFLEVADHTGTLVAPSVLEGALAISIISLIWHIVSTTGRKVSEPSVHHSLVHRKVNDGLFVSVIDTGKAGLFRFSLHDLDLLDDLCRKILRCELRVIKEECLSIDRDLIDGLAVCCDGSVRIHFHARELLQEILQHIIVRCLERRRVVLDGILLHKDRVTDCRYICCIQNLCILCHFKHAKIQIFLDRNFLCIRLISHKFRLEQISAFSDLLKVYISFTV